MRRIKVLQVLPELNKIQHSYHSVAEEIFTALPDGRYEKTYLYLSGEPSPIKSFCAQRQEFLQLKPKQLKGLRILALWRLWRFCRAENFDVIIAHRFKPISILLFISRLLNDGYFFGVIHGMGDFERNYRKRQVRRHAGNRWRFIGVSDAVREYLVRCGSGFTKENTLSITNAINLDEVVNKQFCCMEARSKLNLSDNAILIGLLGRLVPVKGHEFALRAFAKIMDRHPLAQLVIIGEGREREKLELLVKELGLEGRVHLLGFIQDAQRYVRAFDIWAMPSLSEGLGLALLEGMAGALPVIASDVPAMRPLIDGAGGIAVMPGDVDSLAVAFDQYLSLSTKERKVLGQKAFDYVKAAHSIEDYRASYRDLIGELFVQSPEKEFN